jgi:hypothetical protein
MALSLARKLACVGACLDALCRWYDARTLQEHAAAFAGAEARRIAA